MQSGIRRRARINLRALIILVAVGLVLSGGAVGGHYVRKRAMAAEALQKGRQAIFGQRLVEACRHLKDYLQRYPDDQTVLREYADANVEVVPLEPANVGAAIGAYRRILRLDPSNDHAYRRLAALYTATGNHSELRHLAGQRLLQTPGDPVATLFLTTALLGQGLDAEAREHLDRVVEELADNTDHRRQFVDACLQRSEIELREEGSSNSEEDALRWLDRATQAELPLAYARRALFFRTRRNPLGDISLADLTQRAQDDLHRADELDPQDPRVRLLLSQEWMAHGEFDRAEAELRATDALTPVELKEYFLRPADWETLHFAQLVELALRRGSPQDALPAVTQMLAEKADRLRRVAVLPSAIELLAAAGELDKAEQYLTELSEYLLVEGRGSRYEETPALLAAMIADARGEPYAVIAGLESFVDTEVSRPKIYSLLGRALIETGQHRRAIRALRQYLNREPDDRVAALQLVRQFLRIRAWTEAVETAQWASQRWPDSAQVLLTSAEARVQAAAESPLAARQLDRDGLRQDLDRLAEVLPKLVDVALLRAEFDRQDGHSDAARQTLEEAVARCDDPLPALLMLAEMVAAQGDLPSAGEAARRICADYPQEPATWRLLADLCEEQGDVDAARAALEEGLLKVPESDLRKALTMHRALLDLRHSARPAAIERLQQLAAADTKDALVRSLLLEIPEVRKDTAQAEKLVAELRGLEGETGLLWRVHEAARLLAHPDAWQTRQKEIRTHLESCINANPGWQTPALLLGELHNRTGASANAEELYRRTLSANAAATRVGEALLRLLERERRFAEARDVVQRLESTAPIAPARRVRLYLQEGAWRDALDYLKLHLARHGQDFMARSLMARLVYRQSGDAEGALEYLDDANPEPAQRPTVVSARADILHAAGRTEEAISELDSAVTDDAGLASYWLRGEFLAQLGRFEAAEADFRRVQELSEDGRGHVALAGLYASAGRVGDSVRILEEGCKAYPDDADLRRELISTLLARDADGDRERAQKLIHVGDGATPADMVLQARLKLEEQTPQARQAADALLRSAINADPSLVEAYRFLIDIATERGDYSAAQDWATRGLGALPGNPRLLMARAHCEARLQNTHLALELARAAMDRRDGATGLLTQYADLVLDVGGSEDFAAALELLERLPSQDDDVLRRVARLLDRLDRRPEAIARLEAARSDPARPPSTELTLVLAELKFSSGAPEEAGGLVSQALAQEPDNLKLRRAAVIWHAERGQWDEVVALVDGQPVESLPAAHVATIAAAALGATGLPEHETRAIKLFEEVIGRFPEMIKPRLGLAYLRYTTGDPPAAEELYRQVLEREPSHPRALNDLAWLLAERGDFRSGLELVSRAIRLDPTSPNAHDTRAVIYEGMNRLADARLDRQRCVALTGESTAAQASALAKLAELHWKLDDPGAASETLRRALAIDQQLDVFTPQQRAAMHDRLTSAAEQTDQPAGETPPSSETSVQASSAGN